MHARLLPLTVAIAGAVLGACGEERNAEDPTPWFEPGSDLEVQEPIEYTEANYDFTGATPISDLSDDQAGIGPAFGSFETWFAPDDAPSDTACDDWMVGDQLPVEVEGIVTIHPRYYFKTSACRTVDDRGTDEKYYGSYFIQDASGGIFVLGDSKVAHFDMGDRVKLRVRALKESFGSKMVSTHDVLEVQRGPEPIYYEPVSDAELGEAHVGKVVRIQGTVISEMSTFGELYLCEGVHEVVDTDNNGRADCLDEGAIQHKFSLDAELNRRGISYGPGDVVEVTGPVIYSFSEYTIVVMRVGQIADVE
jgi:hypothetical protein